MQLVPGRSLPRHGSSAVTSGQSRLRAFDHMCQALDHRAVQAGDLNDEVTDHILVSHHLVTRVDEMDFVPAAEWLQTGQRTDRDDRA